MDLIFDSEAGIESYQPCCTVRQPSSQRGTDRQDAFTNHSTVILYGIIMALYFIPTYVR